jgi:NTE family protein
MGDWKVGLIENPDVELATAVAASSAFPPLLSPCVLKLDPNSFDKNIPPAAGITPEFRQQAVLADGGVYDNLGLETPWKRYKTVLVSNGGGALGPDADPKHDWISQVNRVLLTIYNQVVTLRTRDIVALYKLKVRDGSYWGIASNIDNYQLANALDCPFDVTTRLAETATRLTALDDTTQEQLIDWGYAICDAGVRRWVLPDAPAPAQSPYGTFKQHA